MHTPTPSTNQNHPTNRTVYTLEWLDYGPQGDTPQWLEMAFPNYEDETTDRDYALECYQKLAVEDPDRMRLVKSNQRTQIIAGPGSAETETFAPQGSEEPAVQPVWLTARQLTLLNYLIVMQRRQLAESNDPEPIAKAIQSDGQPIAGRAGFLTMQLQQLGAAVELTHYRLLFGSFGGITKTQQAQLVSGWLEHLPTARVYRMDMDGKDECIVWHLHLPANQGQPTKEQVQRAITVAEMFTGTVFDHQDQVYGGTYGEFIKAHPGALIDPQSPTPSP